MDEFDEFSAVEEYQKNLHDAVTKYVQTDNPIYTAWGRRDVPFIEKLYYTNKILYYILIWTKGFGILQYCAFVYEENAGIHIIRLTSELKPIEYSYFLPFKDIKKIRIQALFVPYSKTIIKTKSRKFIIIIADGIRYTMADKFGNSGYLAFLEKLGDFARTLK